MSPVLIAFLILILCIVLFITRPIPNAATACLGCILFAITGICSFGDAFSGFSNSTVILMFGMMVVGIAMMDTGVADILGRQVAKWSRNNEKLFILMAGTVSALLSTFLSNTGVIAIFLPIIEGVARSNKKMNRMNMTLPVTLGAMFGGVCTLVGSTPQLTANGVVGEMLGEEMMLKMFDYTLPGLVIFAVYLLYVTVIGPHFAKRIWGDRVPEEGEGQGAVAAVEQKEIVLVKWKVVAILVIFGLTVVSFVLGSLPSSVTDGLPEGHILKEWITPAMTAAIAAVSCICVKCTSVKTVIKKMDWSVVFILAGCLGIAQGIKASGAGEYMGEKISLILHNGLPAIVILAVFVVATMLVSNFITNSTAVLIMLPIALSLCQANGLNPMAFTLAIVFAANLTFSTPLANAQTAMTLTAGYKFSDYIRYTWLLDLMTVAAILVAVPLFFPLVA